MEQLDPREPFLAEEERIIEPESLQDDIFEDDEDEEDFDFDDEEDEAGE